MMETRKIDILYILIRKLNAREKASFNHFLKFYFRKPDFYLDFVKHINKLNAKLDAQAEFPEQALKDIINEPKKFKQYKHKLKTSLFSFLRYDYLEDEENKDDALFMKGYLDTHVLYKKEETKSSYLVLKKMVKPLKELNQFAELLTVQKVLIEFLIPFYGWRNNPEKEYTALHNEILESIHNYQGKVTSKYLKRSMYMKRVNNQTSGIDELLEKLKALKNTAISLENKLECLIGMAHYYGIKKDIDKEIKIRLEVCNTIEKSNTKSSNTLGLNFVTYKMIINLKEETIEAEEYRLYLNKMKFITSKLNYNYWLNQNTLVIGLCEIHHTALFENDSSKIHQILDEYGKKEEYKSSMASKLYLKQLNEYKMICLFIANDFKTCHTESYEVNQGIDNISPISILCNFLSAFMLFKTEFLDRELRNIKRVLKQTYKENYLFLNDFLNLVNRFKKEKRSKNKILEFKNSINVFIENNPKEIKRLEKRIINHFLEQII